MTNNKVAKTLKIIGIVEMMCGIILGLLVLTAFDWVIGLALVLTSFITCMMFIGFAEIVKLLQRSVDMQAKILEQAENNNQAKQQTPKTVLQDIEFNLPEM